MSGLNDELRHFKRHAVAEEQVTDLGHGLKLVRDSMGLWLDFNDHAARVHLDMIGPANAGSSIRKGIDAWQDEFCGI